MTGIGALVGGGFSTIPGSTRFGGQITPLDSESRSLSGARPLVASPEFGGAVPFGEQSGLADGAAGGSCPYKGEVAIAVSTATAAADFFKLRMAILHLKKRKHPHPNSCSSDHMQFTAGLSAPDGLASKLHFVLMPSVYPAFRAVPSAPHSAIQFNRGRLCRSSAAASWR